jgi:ubiquinone/menaquinone biosynthesis C-methylase UbiE
MLYYNHIKLSDHQDEYFSDHYLQVREKEGRLYTDQQVAMFPEIEPSHAHYKEWQIRRQSTGKLFQYLLKKGADLHILEVGCGNGWLSHALSKLPGCKVVGIDINKHELLQAQRVFGDVANLSFMFARIGQMQSAKDSFDIILFASSIQYFSSIHDVIGKSLLLLKPGGEIHIIDSHFYKEEELADARHRSQLYYSEMECNEMANYYYHHQLNDLKAFKPRILSKPNAFKKWIGFNQSPFYWIQIEKS